jgi:hypothetical protein
MSEEYQRYLASRAWGLLKTQVRSRSGGWCEQCRQRGLWNRGTSVHHLTYARLYHERLDDLIHLCEQCHRYESGKSDYPALVDEANPAERPRRERPIPEPPSFAKMFDDFLKTGRLDVFETGVGQASDDLDEAEWERMHDERVHEERMREALLEEAKRQPKPEDPEEWWRREFFSTFGRE